MESLGREGFASFLAGKVDGFGSSKFKIIMIQQYPSCSRFNKIHPGFKALVDIERIVVFLSNVNQISQNHVNIKKEKDVGQNLINKLVRWSEVLFD